MISIPSFNDKASRVRYHLCCMNLQQQTRILRSRLCIVLKKQCACNSARQNDELQFAAVSRGDLPKEDGMKQIGPMQQLKNFLGGGKVDIEKLKKLGSGAIIAYGFTSNVTYGIGVVIAWITYVRQTGVCPLAPGHWQSFLGVYAGIFVLNNIIRPVRFTVAIGITPFVNIGITVLQNKFNVRRSSAFIMMLGLLAATTIAGLAGSIWIFGGFPPQAGWISKQS
eukprot:TRINITY_DN22184_c0_g1_i3.p1 TRINITY_DN22184_c0_g1~~TRINITY_DN22184_c0_g1_i3.p1  ORF type:complete len:224 (-),score=13.00 TRINITY_DN22184_c0_g1_i3:374-1045(-)